MKRIWTIGEDLSAGLTVLIFYFMAKAKVKVRLNIEFPVGTEYRRLESKESAYANMALVR
jgi:hypothetical protein